MVGRSAAVRFLAAAALLLLATLLVNSARGVEVTRESYREAVEPICQANTWANERILAGVRDQVRHGKLKAAGHRFARAATALKKTLAQLRAVPRPPAGRARLAKWLGDIKTEVGLFEAVAAKLEAGQKTAAQGMVVRLTHNANLANNVVIAFEFKYCRFEPSRFT
jgi:hypothetical protein